MRALKHPILKQALEPLKRIRRRAAQHRFFAQRLVSIRCGDFDLESPEHHLLVHLLPSQPQRDLCVGIAAKYIAAKYPQSTFVDIGANIGDTAAMMATHARNKLILIEASDYFFGILSRNVRQLPNETVLVKAFIADGRSVSGTLHHWAGTASIKLDSGARAPIATRRLAELDDGTIRFVKIDTDGYDFKILADSIEWLASSGAAVIFENQIRNLEDLTSANETFDQLAKIGYPYFIVWDDPGLHVLSTTSIDAIKNLNRYQFKIWQANGRRSLHNFDVLCLHARDEDVYQAVTDWYATY